MSNRFLTRVIVGLALLASAAPASAAVTLRGLLLEEGPRTGWFERYQDSLQGLETVDTTAQTFKVGADGALDLTGISGDVRVTGGSGSEIRVEATKRVRHRNTTEAKRLLNDLRVEMTNFNGRVEVRSVYPRRGSYGERGISASVDYPIAVPAGVTVSVRSISGDVIVSGVRGEVRAETVGGDVSVDSTANLALAKTVSGDVIARDIGSATTLVLSTVSGSVIASGLKVRALEADRSVLTSSCRGPRSNGSRPGRCRAASNSMPHSSSPAATNSPPTPATSASSFRAEPALNWMPTPSAAACGPTSR